MKFLRIRSWSHGFSVERVENIPKSFEFSLLLGVATLSLVLPLSLLLVSKKRMKKEELLVMVWMRGSFKE